MKLSKGIFVALLALTTILANSCMENCEECDDSGSICLACKGQYETNVFGGCHANTIDKCVIYGPSDECFRCQPTYSLVQGKCERLYGGCINEGGIGQCYECSFGTTIDNNKCIGVINCDEHSGTNCVKCKQGYTLAGNICKDTSKGCSQVRPSDGICNKCKQGYKRSGFRCFQSKYITQRCYVLKDSQQCQFCKAGYNHVNGKCLLNGEIPKPEQGNEILTIANVNNQGQFSSQTIHIQNCDVPNYETGACVACIYGFFPKQKACQKVSELCDGHNIENGDCFACKFGLTLEKGKCVDKFCSSFKNGKCESCSTGYKLNENNICAQFDQNCIKSTKGRCQQCKTEYYTDMNGKCKRLPNNCATANIQNGVCLECVKDYEMLAPGSECTKKIVIQNCQVIDTKNIGKCLICVYGYFPSGNKCLKVSQLCKDFNVQNGKCTSCISPGFTLNDGRCIDPNCNKLNGDLCTSCKNNYVYSKEQKICKLNDPNCKNLAISSCLECKPKFYISNDKICQSLPSNCQSASPNGVCLGCQSGYQVFNGKCIKKIVIPNCAKADSVNNVCVTCNDRYFASGNVCKGVSLDCDKYNPSTGACLSCKTLKVLQSDGTCIVPPTPPSLPGSNEEYIMKSTNQTSTQLTQNIQSTQNVQSTQNTQITQSIQTSQPVQSTQSSTNTGGIKSVATSPDQNCRQYSGTKCLKCSNRYYVGGQNRCVPVNPLCKQYNNAGQCTLCYPGYRVDSGKCIISQSSDTNCKKFIGQVCSQCYQGYFYSQSQKICKKVNPLCKTSNPQNGDCYSCYPGYSLNQKGTCQVFFKDPNCKQFNSDFTCKACSIKYYVNANGKCSAVSPLCRQNNPQTGACTACYPGYGLTPQGQCQAGISQDSNCKVMQGTTCKQCISGFYFSPDKKCRQASPLCRTFDVMNGNCLTCYAGYQVSNGTCVIAKSQDPNCKKVDAQNQCLICYQGYLPIKGKCKEQNPLCKSIDMSTGGCTNCWPGYALVEANCVAEKELPINSDPFCLKMEGGVCKQCSSNYYYSQSQKQCVQLDPLCKTSNMDTGDCTGCYTGYYLAGNKCNPTQSIQIINCAAIGTNGICVECIEGSYMTENNQCKQVSILCASYDKKNGDCTSCVAGHFLQDGICIFPAMFDQNCVRYESAYCSRCRNGFYLSNFNCQPIDKNCIQFDQGTLTCQSCANGMFPNGPTCL